MRSISIFIVSLTIFLAASCTEETPVIPKDYPYVITNVPVVHSEGAFFSADLISPGNQQIIRYGFVWNEEGKPTTADNHKLFNDDLKKGSYDFNLKSGLAKGKMYQVRAYIQTGQYEVYGNPELFEGQGGILPPVITGFSPKSGPIGTQVIVDGEHFSNSKTGNIVKIGSVTAKIDSATENRIFISIPEIIKPEKALLTVETAGMKASSAEAFDLWFPWLKKSNTHPDIFNSAFFSIGTVGYVVKTNTSNLLTYHPESDEWQNNISLPEYSGNFPIAFAANNKAYMLLVSGFWEYSPLTGNWAKKSDFPGKITPYRGYIFGMTINGNVYLGNCDTNFEFWKYDVSANKWERKANPNANFSHENTLWKNFAFSSNNKGYLGLSLVGSTSNTLWEYDPNQDSWSTKTPWPSNALDLCSSFVINDVAFVGLGTIGAYISGEMWKYDATNDKWIKYHNCPVGMAIYGSFSINNKAYIASMFNKSSQPYEIWEFDPSKN